jgi:hypothetical protein
MAFLWRVVLRVLEFLHLRTPPACVAAQKALRDAHPTWEVLGSSMRAREPDRYVVAVFYQEPGRLIKPPRYQLYAVSADLTVVEELPTNSSSPYWIRGRK